ncbi:bHLH148 protein [Hibiscus syriacus]|uniref:BHLH148 protein n=1 Tax=Hibiscus syriacus TaxID=106335 RepID=A0A6A2YVA6_HIBSY|nr:transcription factor bHLH148-like [Hibiscus syriacus]XP_039023230.1 transcription factor bHLH148-like [Hibiscus syriacus]XP_039023231.1 transcription factor bHLH148-like [Hibiscus syriacus]KAE8683368.1 bHLH148 protein [Hibiscus syriacus]
MASLMTNPVANTTNFDRIKRKKKKNSMMKENQRHEPTHAAWKSEAQQQIYSSKLLQALSQINLNGTTNPNSPTAPRGGRAVREAAYRALAVAARGRTRWSRAILTSRLKLKFRKQKRSAHGGSTAAAVAAVTRTSRSRKPRVSVLKLKAKSVPTVQRKVKVLGRLVPGCRKEPLPVILEEATDYIAALEMQVRAMSALADLLSGSGAASSSSAPPPTGH